MKYKTTMKAIKEVNKNIVLVPYGAAQNLLRGLQPVAYTCGVYGWNADVYRIDIDTVIVTGYRPFGNVRPAYADIKKYDDIAAGIIAECSYLEHAEKLKSVLNSFIEYLEV